MPSNVTDNYKPLNVTDIYYTLYGTIFLPPTAQSLSVCTFSCFKVLMILFLLLQKYRVSTVNGHDSNLYKIIIIQFSNITKVSIAS